jgi:hypothetical protein
MKNVEKYGGSKKAWLKIHQKSAMMVCDVPIFCEVYYMRGFLALRL